MKKNKNKNKRHLWVWIEIAVASLLVIFSGFIFKYMHWPGGSTMMIFMPVCLVSLVYAITKMVAILGDKNRAHADECGLKVDYRVRYAIGSTMRMKRRGAWALLVAGALILVGHAVLVILRGLMFITPFALLTSLSLALLGATTLREAKLVEGAVQTSDQRVFEDAMRRWSKRCKWTYYGYFLYFFLAIGAFVLGQYFE